MQIYALTPSGGGATAPCSLQMSGSGALLFIDATGKSFPATSSTAPVFATNQLVAGQFLLQVAPPLLPREAEVWGIATVAVQC